MKKGSFTGLGLIFGSAIGFVVTLLMSYNIAWAFVGTGVGLILGSIIDANVSKKQ